MKLHDNQLQLLRHLARFNLLDYGGCLERNKPTRWSRSPIKLRADYEHVYLTTFSVLGLATALFMPVSKAPYRPVFEAADASRQCAYFDVPSEKG